MKFKLINFLSIFLGFCAVIALFYWLFTNPVKQFTEFHPGLDNRPATMRDSAAEVKIGEHFASFAGIPSNLSGSWPRFRGSGFDNISKEHIPLAEKWDESGPEQLWSVELGEGYSGPVVQNGRVYVLDYDEENRRDVLRCFSFDNGQEIWQRGYDVFVKRNHGMSRTVPSVKDNYVVSIGPKCHVMCVTADSGKLVWGIDIEKKFNSEVPLWYTGQCPLIQDSLAIIATGGDALLIGVHLATGEIAWQTPNPDKWKMSHSSVIPMTILQQKFFVYCAIGGVVGISADSSNMGQVLFKTNEWNPSVIAPSPVYLGNNKIFLTAGYGAGSALMEIIKNNGAFSVNILQKYKPEEGLASEQQTPILYDGFLFSILPKDAGPKRNQFVCSNAENPKNILWSSNRDARFGLGPYFIADDKFYILSDDGILTLAKLSTKEYIQLSQTKVLQGQDAWGPMALINGRLLCRDSRTLVCLDVRAKS